MVVECVVNISEGRDREVLDQLSAAAGSPLLDRHLDAHHHRSVFTLAGSPDDVAVSARSLARAAVALIDLSAHEGAHPRLGVVDVVPFVPYDPGQPPPTDLGAAVALRDEFARFMGADLQVPTFLYGPVHGGGIRTLPQVRKRAFSALAPDEGPPVAHPTAGATAAGARTVLVAYNVWVSSLEVARGVVPQVRGPGVRALALQIGDRAQVSCNLVDPSNDGPEAVYDMVTAAVGAAGGAVEGAELVGLLPRSVLDAVPQSRWSELGLSSETTVESRLPPG